LPQLFFSRQFFYCIYSKIQSPHNSHSSRQLTTTGNKVGVDCPRWPKGIADSVDKCRDAEAAVILVLSKFPTMNKGKSGSVGSIFTIMKAHPSRTQQLLFFGRFSSVDWILYVGARLWVIFKGFWMLSLFFQPECIQTWSAALVPHKWATALTKNRSLGLLSVEIKFKSYGHVVGISEAVVKRETINFRPYTRLLEQKITQCRYDDRNGISATKWPKSAIPIGHLGQQSTLTSFPVVVSCRLEWELCGLSILLYMQ
jgi:hypothetical protein